jgi:type IV secretory pathway TrbD component
LNPEKFAFAVGVAVFAAGSLGLILHRVLPEKHVTGGGKDMIAAVVGLLTLLSALVLGLLIWTAYGVYAGQNIAIETLAAKVLQLDLALADYGPEANDARGQLRRGLGKSIDEIWGSKESDADFVAKNFAAAIQNLRNRDASLAALHPSTDAQTQALAAAKSTVESISQSRLQMSFALASPIPFRSS